MAAKVEDQPLRERLQRVETLVQEVERFKEPEARAKTKEIVQGLMDFHGAGLERILERISENGEAGLALIQALAEDEVVGSLLLLYGLHPVDHETRVLAALEKARPFLKTHGGNVELLGVADGVVRLRLVGSCHGCPSSAVTLKQTIEEAIYEKAPDTAGIEVEEDAVTAEAVVEMSVSVGQNSGGHRAGIVSLPILAR